MSEIQFVESAKRGDEAAFIQIYEHYHPAIYRYIFYRAEDIATAEELSEFVFARLAEQIDTLAADGSDLQTWLYRTAERFYSDHSRTLSPQTQPTAARTAKPSLSSHQLAEATALLAEDQRQVILLKFVEGLDNQTIATIMGKTVLRIHALQQEALVALSMSLAWYEALQTPRLPQRRQEEMEQFLQDIFQNVSHELRSPVTLIQGNVELLLSGLLGPIQPRQRKALEVVNRRAEALGEVISKLTTPRTIPEEVLTIESISILEWINAATKRYRVNAEVAGIKLETNIAADVSTMMGDPAYLRAGLAQLLDNAIKFSPSGGRVTLRVWEREDWVYVEVKDQGIGIPPEQLDRIFDPFCQADTSTTRTFDGIGLGLSVVKAVAEAHGGRVWAASAGKEKGATFTMALPVSPSETARAVPSLSNRPGPSNLHLYRALETCLSAIEKEGASYEDCLARYPGYAKDLQWLLKTAENVRRTSPPAPSPAAFVHGKERMLQAIKEKKRRQSAEERPLSHSGARIADALYKHTEPPSKPHRAPALRPAYAIAFALVAVIFAGLFFVYWQSGSVNQRAALSYVSGPVDMMTLGSASWQPVSLGNRFGVGDRLRTGEHATAMLVFLDGSVARLDPNTDVTIAQLSAQRDGSNRTIVLYQLVGQMISQVAPATGNRARFQVITPAASASALGTQFLVAVESDGTTRVTVTEGVVDVSAAGDSVEVRAGEETEIASGQPPMPAVHIPAERIAALYPEAWDRSSLQFSSGCAGDCDQIGATICNDPGAERMESGVLWELYWSAAAAPQDGIVLASGVIEPLAPGECQTLSYHPPADPAGASGNFMFRVYQRPGHPGSGSTWSIACSLACTLETAEPVGVPEPTQASSRAVAPTPTPGATLIPTLTVHASPTLSPAAETPPPSLPTETATPRPPEPTATTTPRPPTTTPTSLPPSPTATLPPPTPTATATPVPPPTPTPTGVPDEWDHSALYFASGCEGDCEQISATVCNEINAQNMAGPTTWQLYWAASGNPRDGVVVASGTVNPLAAGSCQVLEHDPSSSGNYSFKVYQRPGHPGVGETWSGTCELICASRNARTLTQ
ncbi:MAG: FecR domain-containing protein [Anaerolineae bacterium]|nr:FecR domain-containing protein [Anaerolineae bacterium]